MPSQFCRLYNGKENTNCTGRGVGWFISKKWGKKHSLYTWTKRASSTTFFFSRDETSDQICFHFSLSPPVIAWQRVTIIIKTFLGAHNLSMISTRLKELAHCTSFSAWTNLQFKMLFHIYGWFYTEGVSHIVVNVMYHYTVAVDFPWQSSLNSLYRTIPNNKPTPVLS